MGHLDCRNRRVGVLRLPGAHAYGHCGSHGYRDTLATNSNAATSLAHVHTYIYANLYEHVHAYPANDYTYPNFHEHAHAYPANTSTYTYSRTFAGSDTRGNSHHIHEKERVYCFRSD